ncbi:FkbM family methyltransferase [Halobellus salinisoli]|uniref:FkbM family methyltransferase n=1 Tax=Halobellus salinisoli TaxID=3108500 RepID=UPI003009646E
MDNKGQDIYKSVLGLYRGLLNNIRRIYQEEVRDLSIRIGLDPVLSNIFSEIYPYPYVYQTEYRGEIVEFKICSSTERPTSFKDKLLNNMIDNLNSDDVYFDIGAGTGTISCIIGSHIDEGKIYAFEPLPANFEAIQRNFDQNSLNGDIFQCALSNTSGEMEFAVPDENIGAGYTNASLSTDKQSISHFWNDKKKKIKVQSEKGDDLIQKEEIPAPNIISIDVEGAEVDVIQGLRNTLSSKECRLVFVEVHKYLLSDFGTSSEDLEDKLRSLGFNISRFDRREFEIDGEQGQLYRIAAHK